MDGYEGIVISLCVDESVDVTAWIRAIDLVGVTHIARDNEEFVTVKALDWGTLSVCVYCSCVCCV